MRSIRRLLHHQKFTNRRGEKQETRSWYITIRGKHHPLGEDLAEAEARAREMLSRTARVRVATTNPRLDDLLEMVQNDYVANRRAALSHYKPRVARLVAYFGNPHAAAIQTTQIRAYQAHRLAESAKPATINVELALLQRGFSLARQDGMVETVPTFPRLTENNARKGFFERAEMLALVSCCPEYLQGIVRAAYLTGWRKMEILTRQWRHVDAGWLRLDPGETKNGEGREFPMIPELREVLDEQRAFVDALQAQHGKVIPWIFPDAKGHPITHFWFDWDRARKLSHTEHRIFHDFRRTAVRNMEQAGVPRSAAMALVGHKTQSMYSRYAISDRGMLDSAGEKLTFFHSRCQNAELKTSHFQQKNP